jgi:type IV pilus assembly protein PilX
MKSIITPPLKLKKQQNGVSLPIVLMFLLVITILGTLGIKRATTGEILSRNQLDYEVARQAAEAALRDAERDLLLNASNRMPNALCERGADRPLSRRVAYFSPDCVRGQCQFENKYYKESNYSVTPNPKNPEPWWPTSKGGLWGNDPDKKPSDSKGVGKNCIFNGAVPLGTFTGVQRIAGVEQQPEYLIEYLKRGDQLRMRITARGFGADLNTEVVMQSYFQLNEKNLHHYYFILCTDILANSVKCTTSFTNDTTQYYHFGTSSDDHVEYVQRPSTILQSL